MKLATARANAHKAKREGQPQGFLALVDAGETAKAKGLGPDACPWAPGSDEADSWFFGYNESLL